MSTDLVLSALSEQSLITKSDIDILRGAKFKGFTDSEVAYAIKIASSLRLNPMLNQIHFVKRGQAVTAQVGIDGFRLLAMRAGGYAGSDEPVFEYGTDNKRPLKASVIVYKMIEGQRCPFSGTARWDEYYPGSNQMWDKMPHNQLAKCAEALALRKAFPAELSSVYSEDEMHQADRNTKAQEVAAQVKQEPIEVKSEVVEQERSAAPASKPCCPNCGADPQKIIVSKSDRSNYYCFGCRKAFPIQMGAA